MSDEIKGLINEEGWNKAVEVNSADGYSMACVNVARNVMRYLDTFEGEFNIGYHPDMTTPHGIICHCDDQGGITGFMAGAARNMVACFHRDGWKFYLADAISEYDIDNPARYKKSIDALVNAENIEVTREEAERYVQELVKRYKENKK